MMRILVTGANGQVGHEFKAIAQDSKHTFECLDRSQLDITNEAQINECLNRFMPDLVINCAAYTAVDKAENDVDMAYAINAHGAGHLANECKAIDAAMIHISTDYVFAGDTLSPYKENDPTEPTGIYGASKLAGEKAVAKKLNKHIILRTAWVFGAHGNNFVKTMLRLGAERDQLGVVHDQLGAPTSAKGIAECCMAIAEVIDNRDPDDVHWGTYHFCGAPYSNWFEFAEHIFSAAVTLGLLDKAPKLNSISSDQFPTPAKRPSNSRLKCAKLMSHFEIAPDDWSNQLNEVLIEISKKDA